MDENVPEYTNLNQEEDSQMSSEEATNSPQHENGNDPYPFLKPYYLKRYLIIGGIFSISLIGLTLFALFRQRATSRPDIESPTTPVSTPSPQDPNIDPGIISDPTYFWKVYKSNLLPLEFKYPNSWTLYENPIKLSYTDNSVSSYITNSSQTEYDLSYCKSHYNEAQRCKMLKSVNSIVSIDLGDANSLSVNAILISPKGRFINLEMKIENSKLKSTLGEEDKKLFTTFVTTFTVDP